MAPVTEFAYIPLKAGTSLDPSSDTGKAMTSVLDTLRSQPGLQRIKYATEIENPASMRLFIDWDSLDAHKEFMNKPEYGPFMKNLGGFVDGSPVLFHAPLNPHPPVSLSPTVSPTTEVLFAYFDSNLSESDQKTFESNMQKLVEVINNDAPGNGFKAAASSGWAIEPLKHNGKDTKAFVATLGWESKQAHEAVTQTQPFKDNIHLLRDAKGLVGTEMFHVQNEEVQPGANSSLPPVQDEVLNPQEGQKKPPSTTSDGMSTKYTK